MRRHFISLLLVTAAAGIVGCHQQMPGQPGAASGSVITREQIDSSSANNVYDLIARLHGNFLRDRGKVSILSNQHDRPMVFLNDQEYGELESMRNIPTGRVAEIRFFSGTDAVTRFGSQYGGGVIQLISRTQ